MFQDDYFEDAFDEEMIVSDLEDSFEDLSNDTVPDDTNVTNIVPNNFEHLETHLVDALKILKDEKIRVEKKFAELNLLNARLIEKCENLERCNTELNQKCEAKSGEIEDLKMKLKNFFSGILEK